MLNSPNQVNQYSFERLLVALHAAVQQRHLMHHVQYLQQACIVYTVYTQTEFVLAAASRSAVMYNALHTMHHCSSASVLRFLHAQGIDMS
jgi:hypothetical protein